MSKPVDVRRLEGGDSGNPLFIGLRSSVPNAAGSAAGASVTTAVSFLAATNGGQGTAGDLPANYTAVVNPGQDATWFISGKTAGGFNVTLTPRLASATLAAGMFDAIVIG